MPPEIKVIGDVWGFAAQTSADSKKQAQRLSQIAKAIGPFDTNIPRVPKSLMLGGPTRSMLDRPKLRHQNALLEEILTAFHESSARDGGDSSG
jgi:hypothetical protein